MITENKYGVHIIILVNFNLDNILTIPVKHFIKKSKNFFKNQISPVCPLKCPIINALLLGV